MAHPGSVSQRTHLWISSLEGGCWVRRRGLVESRLSKVTTKDCALRVLYSRSQNQRNIALSHSPSPSLPLTVSSAGAQATRRGTALADCVLKPPSAFRKKKKKTSAPGKANATNSVASSPAKPRQSTEARGDDAASSAAGLKTTRTRQLKSRPGLSCARRSLRRWALASDAAPSTCAHVMLVSHS